MNLFDFVYFTIRKKKLRQSRRRRREHLWQIYHAHTHTHAYREKEWGKWRWRMFLSLSLSALLRLLLLLLLLPPSSVSLSRSTRSLVNHTKNCVEVGATKKIAFADMILVYLFRFSFSSSLFFFWSCVWALIRRWTVIFFWMRWRVLFFCIISPLSLPMTHTHTHAWIECSAVDLAGCLSILIGEPLCFSTGKNVFG